MSHLAPVDLVPPPTAFKTVLTVQLTRRWSEYSASRPILVDSWPYFLQVQEGSWRSLWILFHISLLPSLPAVDMLWKQDGEEDDWGMRDLNWLLVHPTKSQHPPYYKSILTCCCCLVKYKWNELRNIRSQSNGEWNSLILFWLKYCVKRVGFSFTCMWMCMRAHRHIHWCSRLVSAMERKITKCAAKDYNKWCLHACKYGIDLLLTFFAKNKTKKTTHWRCSGLGYLPLVLSTTVVASAIPTMVRWANNSVYWLVAIYLTRLGIKLENHTDD